MNVRLTQFTASIPSRLTKLWRLDGNGQPEKISGGQMMEGHAKVVGVADVDEFAALLQTLKPSQALAYGIPPIDEGPVMTRQAWLAAGKPVSAVCRTKECMQWPDGPGVLFLDYDPKEGTKTLSREELISTLESICPALAECGFVHWVSSSSNIFRVDTGEQVRGLAGQRLYYLVENAIDIPEAGERLQTHLWANGFGHIKITTAGSLLSRTVVDSTVWQTNRLDFAAGAECVPPLVQRRGVPFVRPGRLVRLLTDIPKPSDADEQRARRAIEAAKAAAAPEAARVKEEHINRLAVRTAGDNATPDEVNAARETVRRAMDGGVLGPDYLISVIKGQEVAEIRVREILENAREYDGADTLDPIEHDYDGGRPVGRLYLTGGPPRLHSFAHGGRTFKLLRPSTMIEVVRGCEHDVDEHVMHVMRESQEFFEHAGRLVQVAGGKIIPVTEYGLLFWVRANCTFYKRVYKNGVAFDVLVPASLQTIRVVMEAGSYRRLPILRAIITAQTVGIDGALIKSNGYDPDTGLLLCVDDETLLPVPDAPTIDEAIAAYRRLLHPFRLFPYVGTQDTTVMLAAILSAVVRPAIDTCPGFGFDAPVQASGKTLLAKAVHAIATGRKAIVKPHVEARDDEETRKRILAILLEGEACVVWDNIKGVFNSESMAALLTSGEFGDRVLGKSATAKAPNSALWLFTGNNLQIAGDMPRRMFRCRIDPKTDEPFAREFDFDPEAYCLQRRHELVRDALILINAWIAAGRPRAKGRTASFEQWDELVRQPIAWLSGYLHDDLVDPLDAMRTGQAEDPENDAWGEFLRALDNFFSGRSFTAGEVLEIYNDVENSRRGRAGVAPPKVIDEAIHESIVEAIPKGTVTAKKIGRHFFYRQDRIVEGLRLCKHSKKANGVEWIVHDTNKAATLAQSNTLAQSMLEQK